VLRCDIVHTYSLLMACCQLLVFDTSMQIRAQLGLVSSFIITDLSQLVKSKFHSFPPVVIIHAQLH
jgi:hypothetical protein